MDERSIMVLTGQAKKDYQREYMRKRSKKSSKKDGSKAQGLTQYPRVTDQEFTRRLATLPPGSPTVRVSKPGDATYEAQCETTRAFEGRPKAVPELEPKRGLAIKCFEDLPADVQQTINQMCRIDDNKIDATAKANRTVIAIRYQHLFPDRF